MSLPTLVWKLASPYDAYVSHVSRLEAALARLRFLSGQALGYETGLLGSVRVLPGEERPAEERADKFRARLAEAAEGMTDEQFEAFLAELGGGETARVEADRAQVSARLGTATRGLQEYFAVAAAELATLERRGYDPWRRDISRQLRDNGIVPRTIAEYRHELHELGRALGVKG
ncbi:MAG: hypothetical protein Kow0010_14100 [Dehalococcoidia bacterium]